MRILGWSIDGFGLFHDYEVRDLPEGVTVFHGPNEAGKSTLLAFLRGVLFGFPDRRRRMNRYEPLRGGRHGGRVVLLGEGGEVVVERRADVRQPPRVLLPDGEGTEQDLLTLLGSADETLFSNVFAFSLAELHSMESLTREGVSNRIFSAGIAGAGRDARAAMNALEDRAAGLLKQGRGKGRLNELAAELSELAAKLKEARDAAKGYAALVEAERAHAEEVEGLSRRAAELQRERDHCETLLKLWPLRSEIHDARQELAALEDTEGFPQDAVLRLESALEKVRQAEMHLQDRKAEKDAAEKRIAQLVPDEAAGRIAAEIEALFGDLALQQERLRNAPLARAALRSAQEALAEKLADLGPDWPLERLESFDRSIPRSEEVREWDQRIRAAEEAVQAARLRQKAANGRAAELEQRKSRLAASLPAEPPPEKTALEEEARVLGRLRANWGEFRNAERDLRSYEESARERERIASDLGAAPEPVRLRSAYLGCRIAAVVFFVAAIIGFAATAPVAGIAFLALAGMLFASDRLLVRFDRRQVRLQEQVAARLETARREGEGAAAERDRAAERVEALKSALAKDAAALGMAEPPDPQRIEERAAQTARARAARDEWDRAHAESKAVDENLKQAAAESDAAEEAASNAAAELAQVRRGWAEWRAGAGIEAELDPNGVLDVFHAVDQARTAAQSQREAAEKAEAIEREAAEWEARACALLGEATGEPPTASGEELAALVREWRSRCQKDAETRRQRDDIEAALPEIQARIASAEKELRRCNEERDRLFQAARAADEEEFRRRAEVFKRRNELEAGVAENERQIRHVLGKGEAADALAKELEGGLNREWEQRLEQAKAEWETIESRRDDALRAHRDAETKRQQLSESADVPALENQFAQVREELADAAEEWRTVSAARALIAETLREFERTRQPEVLAQASGWFGKVTGGRYVRLSQGEGEGELLIHHRDGGARGVDALSRGTAEQLYVCIRLGLAAEFGRRARALPFVMDDVLVNFDPGRARAMAEALVQFAEGRQVLFFTCHPGTRDLLQELGEAHAVELETGNP